ncbi:MAG: hypothetical protein CFE23_08290 [Flavobacterium sp. BFFFF1]|uniref:TonB-dependent receptor n=1 Tax=Flavobacterium sp. BFFFF1 TaxID=2015557 RepID=UPI000BC85018|nr:TonB-dependent receptor [Flavobacterium sp. BFFFF1]OYU80708.1 MAG: hypothetical protein CFE23_08290 [Flavobacterium sp. BFFFF1]
MTHLTLIEKTALVFLFFVNAALAQTFTINGKVTDASNGETLLGCNILVIGEGKSIRASTNEYGFYSITLAKGTYELRFSYVGYIEYGTDIALNGNTVLNVVLTDNSTLSEVVISTNKNDKTKSTSIGSERINIKDIENLPVIFGEKDILKTIQLLPGVKSNGEAGIGFSVRGGGFDQNLILLDEAPVYNASHLLGFFSTFNSDALKSATLIKGNPPAQYGGRLSSVLDVVMKDGGNQEATYSGGLGLISSRINIAAPIQKNKSSFLISARRTYADLFLKASKDFKDNQIYFYDLNFKANYEINAKNKAYLSAYFGRDVLGIGTGFGIDWGNATATFRLNSILSPKVFVNTSLIYSKYSYNVSINSGSDVDFGSTLEDYNLKQDYQWYFNTRNKLRFGFNTIFHNIDPTRVSGDQISQDVSAKTIRKNIENALYLSHEYQVFDWMKTEYGVRYSAFSIMGSGLYNYYSAGVKTGSVELEKGEIGKTYSNLEPRLSVNFNLSQHSSIKLAYAKNTQNLHLLSNSTSGRPSDQWIGSTFNVKPEISHQFSAGYFRYFGNGNYELNTEAYYKKLTNQIDYKNGANINTAPDLESELLYGKGRAYGFEMQIKKNKGKFTGWLSYTLSKTEKQIDGINNDRWYNARQDRTHDLSLVSTYEFNDKWTFSALFVYNTGNAVTFPSGKYEINGSTVFYYNGRNQDRMPDYHRLDLSATLKLRSSKEYNSSLNFSLYNAYGRENAYLIDFEDDPDNPAQTRAVQTALFKFIPSVTYNFSF